MVSMAVHSMQLHRMSFTLIQLAASRGAYMLCGKLSSFFFFFLCQSSAIMDLDSITPAAANHRQRQRDRERGRVASVHRVRFVDFNPSSLTALGLTPPTWRSNDIQSQYEDSRGMLAAGRQDGSIEIYKWIGHGQLPSTTVKADRDGKSNKKKKRRTFMGNKQGWILERVSNHSLTHSLKIWLIWIIPPQYALCMQSGFTNTIYTAELLLGLIAQLRASSCIDFLQICYNARPVHWDLSMLCACSHTHGSCYALARSPDSQRLAAPRPSRVEHLLFTHQCALSANDRELCDDGAEVQRETEKLVRERPRLFSSGGGSDLWEWDWADGASGFVKVSERVADERRGPEVQPAVGRRNGRSPRREESRE